MKPRISIHNNIAIISYLGVSILAHKDKVDEGIWAVMWWFHGNEYTT